MIFGHIDHVETTFGWLPEPLRAVLAHLRSQDFGKQPAGSYDFRGKDIFIQVIDTKTRPVAETRAEVHQKYIDIQFLWSGREGIGVVSDLGQNQVDEDFLSERDLLFYKNVENETMLDLRPGNFAILFPDDVHRPLCAMGAPEPVRKIVVKVARALLS